MRDTIRLTQPEKETEVVENLTGLPVTRGQRPGLKFVYVHYPQSWRFDMDRGWVPNLSKIYAKPGVNGVTKTGDMTQTLAHVQKKGGTVINPKDERLGQYQNYCHYYPTRNGGRWYVDFCQKAEVLPNDQIIWNDSEIEEPLLDFAAHLVRAGIVRPMLKEVFSQYVEKERAKLDNLFGRLDRNPHLKARCDETEKRLEKMQQTWDEMNQEMIKTTTPIKPTKRID